ncbi:hypothetical protein AAFF_G00061620 [Aldrovandia affinis]|uniref:Uncharacterized protein n=1 Tax=Aldrovandia affinis TaxID=143900 RepID=A0AAD7S063_9TELE|nr:hypothetical protein AAFF_G00061620 [Aldrovandia affinis]
MQTVGLIHTLEQCLNRMQTVGLIHTLEQCLNSRQTVGLIHTLEQCLNSRQTVGLIHTLEQCLNRMNHPAGPLGFCFKVVKLTERWNATHQSSVYCRICVGWHRQDGFGY